jgi:Na+-transporting NADH:ubiquinone oxidoreductase subunit C
MAKDSAIGSFTIVLLLALVCSALVAGTAVGLRDRQEANRLLDRQKNILLAADLYEPGADLATMLAAVETRIVRLADGAFVPAAEIDPEEFNQLEAALDPQTGRELSRPEDLAGLGRVEKYSLVYLVRDNGRIDRVVLPIRGRGVWSTMHAYIALADDFNTVVGVTFYLHGETPGLGGEIENPAWQESWQGKQIYDRQNQPSLRVIKGQAPTGEAGAHQIDGISGATRTLDGVSKLLEFWFGEHGFQPFLERLRAGEINDER